MDNFKEKIQNRLDDRHNRAKGSWEKLLIRIVVFALIVIGINGYSEEKLKKILNFGKSPVTEINGSSE